MPGTVGEVENYPRVMPRRTAVRVRVEGLASEKAKRQMGLNNLGPV